MSQYFNLTRFGRLFSKHTAEHALGYGMGMAVLFGGILLVMGFLTYLQGSPPSLGGQSVFFTLFLLAAGFFFASLALNQFSERRQAALALTLPASQVEKYVVAWLYSLPIFLVVYTAVFYAADWLVLHLMGQQEAPPMLNIFTRDTLDILGVYLVVHSLALWGSIFYQRLQFVKAAFAAFLALVLLGLVNYQVLKSFVGSDLVFTVPLSTVRFHDGSELVLPDAQEHWLALLPLALTALLWLAAYARLTEKQL